MKTYPTRAQIDKMVKNLRDTKAETDNNLCEALGEEHHTPEYNYDRLNVAVKQLLDLFETEE